MGSEDGSLATEYFWDLKVPGCGGVSILQTVLGEPVPVSMPLSCPTVPALSADGTRILIGDDNADATQTTLELVDAQGAWSAAW